MKTRNLTRTEVEALGRIVGCCTTSLRPTRNPDGRYRQSWIAVELADGSVAVYRTTAACRGYRLARVGDTPPKGLLGTTVKIGAASRVMAGA